MRPIRPVSAAVILFAAIAPTMTHGCAGAGPSASGGLPIAGTRFVSVGDEITFRLPASEATGVAEWTLDSFDSVMLRLATQPRLETGAGAGPEWVVRFVARSPGTTQISFRRTSVTGGSAAAGERRSFRIRISR